MNDSSNYYQGVYAGPLTQRATDYNGHEVIGVQISDEAPDGSVYFVTLDEHMQLSIAPVMAASIMPYEPEEPVPPPVLEPEDYIATRRSLEDIIRRILKSGPGSVDELRMCALAMSELANVIDTQMKVWNNGAQAAQAAGASTCTGEVGTACRASDGAADPEREGEAPDDVVSEFIRFDGDREQESEIDPDYAEDVR